MCARKLVAVFFALWLPFSAVAAAMMPLCVHEGAKPRPVAESGQHGCEQYLDVAVPSAGDEDLAAGNCSQCGLCLFSATPWLPGGSSLIDVVAHTASAEGFIRTLDSRNFPPEVRPPLSAA